MRSDSLLLCALALACPELALAQQAGEVDATDYSDYFGESPQQAAASEGPHSLGEARLQGKAYRLGQPGGMYRKAPRDVHTVREGDTLWDISDRYFGDPWHWPELWSYNPEITNPHWIYPLDHVRLSAAGLDDDAVAAAAPRATAAKNTAAGFQEPKQGLVTDLAPRVAVPAKFLQGDTVFLRDEGYLDDTDLKQSGQIVAGAEENMLLADSDLLYVRFNRNQKVEIGQQYTVYRPVHKWEREVGETGRLVRIQGTVLIRSFDAQRGIARAVITETIDPIERGMPVTLMDRRFILAPPRPNQTNVVAHIIGSTQPRALLAFGNVVFLSVGKGHGIEPGNRFFVVRRGDNWLDVLQRPAEEMGNIVPVPKYDPSQLPKEVVAEMRVMAVRRNVVIAVITRSDTDVFQGEPVEMRVGY
jgi:LysM domain